MLITITLKTDKSKFQNHILLQSIDLLYKQYFVAQHPNILLIKFDLPPTLMNNTIVIVTKFKNF